MIRGDHVAMLAVGLSAIGDQQRRVLAQEWRERAEVAETLAELLEGEDGQVEP